jgi:hypothetical protein
MVIDNGTDERRRKNASLIPDRRSEKGDNLSP